MFLKKPRKAFVHTYTGVQGLGKNVGKHSSKNTYKSKRKMQTKRYFDSRVSFSEATLRYIEQENDREAAQQERCSETGTKSKSNKPPAKGAKRATVKDKQKETQKRNIASFFTTAQRVPSSSPLLRLGSPGSDQVVVAAGLNEPELSVDNEVGEEEDADWTCLRCTFQNAGLKLICEVSLYIHPYRILSSIQPLTSDTAHMLTEHSIYISCVSWRHCDTMYDLYIYT